MKFILFFITILFSCCVFSQQNLKYVDSLKKIVNKGMPDGYSKKDIIKLNKYIKACEILGDFSKSNKNIKKALYYYLLVAELGDGPDSKLGSNYIAVKLRDKICLKTGDLYFKGIGIKKDLNKAISYHTKGLLGNNWDKADYYSKLYFHSTDRILFIEKTIYLTGDSSTVFSINPFYFFRKFPSTTISKFIKQIKVIINQDTSWNCTLKMEAGNVVPYTETGDAALYRTCEQFYRSLIEKNVFNVGKIKMNIVRNNFSCAYKSFYLPCLDIKLTKIKFVD